ncbi:MAG: hypothetical protein AB9834_19340 [Lentimicrobium sp.]
MIFLNNSLPAFIEKAGPWLQSIESVVTIAAIIVGGYWTYRRFIRQREDFALIDFSVDIEFHAKIKDWWIVEIIAYIENKGKVQHKIELFDFKLESINSTDNIDDDEEHRNQVLFPNIIAENSFKSKDAGYFFIEPGLKNKYSHVAKVPANAEVLLLHSWFDYLDGKHSHIAEITKKVPVDQSLYIETKRTNL